MKRHLAASLVVLCLAFPALAARPVVPDLPIQTSLPAEILLTQQELAVEVPGTADAVGMQFGLLGALIGTAVANAQVKNGEQRVREIRDALLDYPFNARMEDALRRKLAEHRILGDQGVAVRHATWDGSEAATVDAVEDALVLAPRYAIRNDFEQMSVTVALSHVQRTSRAGKKTKQKPLFVRHYAFNFPLSPIEGSDAEADAARWAGFGAAPLSTLLDRGIDQVTDMLVYDLSAEGRAEALEDVRGHTGAVVGQSFDGRVVREGDGWLWLRTRMGATRPLVGQHPVNAVVVAALPAAAAPAADTLATAAGPDEAMPAAAEAAHADAGIAAGATGGAAVPDGREGVDSGDEDPAGMEAPATPDAAPTDGLPW